MAVFAQAWFASSAAIVLSGLVVAAVAAPWIAPHDPYDLSRIDMLDGRLPPGSLGSLGTHWLGTDEQGRDLLSAILFGLRVSLGIGLGSALVAAVFGTAFGLGLAHAGLRLGALLGRLVDLQLATPSILIAMMIVAVRGKSTANVFLALVIVEWAYYARTAHGAAATERSKPYIEATEALGVAPWRIALGHLLPNCLPPLTVILTAQISRAIALEATLSFLGVGVSVTQPSLGLLIANGRQYFFSGQYWMIVYPGLVLSVLILSINVIGDRIRDGLDTGEARSPPLKGLAILDHETARSHRAANGRGCRHRIWNRSAAGGSLRRSAGRTRRWPSASNGSGT